VSLSFHLVRNSLSLSLSDLGMTLVVLQNSLYFYRTRWGCARLSRIYSCFIVCLFVCLLLNGTSALFRLLVPIIVEIKQVKNDLKKMSDQFYLLPCSTGFSLEFEYVLEISWNVQEFQEFVMKCTGM